MSQREHFSSRLGFLLISAGCAIGLGNVWRFPYIAGQYGGGAFVLLYIVFLLLFSLPILVMEFSVGRASQRSAARAFDVLEPAGSKWHHAKWISYFGCFLLMMFYTTVAGWMLAYVQKSAVGTFVGATPEMVGGVFDAMLANPAEMVFWMLVVVLIGMATTSGGLQKGVERITKFMMIALLVVLVLLVVRSLTLPGAAEGVKFYLMPDFNKLVGGGLLGVGETIYAAMGHAFFTLSIGVGTMTIFGSYIDRERTLSGESLRIGALDTSVAILSGLIIFPACFAFGVEPGVGPGLVFATLPSVFEQMPLGQLWCSLFFVFMSFAALSTIVTVIENLIAFSMEQWDITRSQAVMRNGIALAILSLPCALGFNLWSGFEIAGLGNIQAIEDFILSNNILPIGSLVFLLFCTRKSGWGWQAFLKEADTGRGAKYPAWARVYISYVIPVLVVIVLIMGWVPVVSTWIGA